MAHQQDREQSNGAKPVASHHEFLPSEDRDYDLAGEAWIEPAVASRYMITPIARNRFPQGGMPSRVAQQIVRDQRLLDSSPRLNLASFVTTWMETEADELYNEIKNINFADEFEYPSTTQIHETCVSMLADLFHAEDPAHAVGTATVGSSEACILGGLAMKRRWRDRRKKEGKATDKPNLVIGTECHVCWQKFLNYFEVEPRYVPVDGSKEQYIPTAEKMAAACDENTIGVVGILGTTYSGQFEDIAGMDKLIGELNEKNGWGIGIHVDGATGAFVAPFLYPDLAWDFRLKNVVSINTSGHKFGLVYPGIGWLVFRNKECLPDSLILHDNYLGADQATYNLNFSKGAPTIVAQYYQFLRLGRTGYTKVMKNCHKAAMYIANKIKTMDHHFDLISDDKSLPVVVFRLRKRKNADTGEEEERSYTEFDLAERLRERGWVVPAYTMAPDAENVRVLRVLCREDFSLSVANALLEDINNALEWLDLHFVLTADQMKELRNKGNKQHLKPKEAKGPQEYGVC